MNGKRSVFEGEEFWEVIVKMVEVVENLALNQTEVVQDLGQAQRENPSQDLDPSQVLGPSLDLCLGQGHVPNQGLDLSPDHVPNLLEATDLDQEVAHGLGEKEINLGQRLAGHLPGLMLGQMLRAVTGQQSQVVNVEVAVKLAQAMKEIRVNENVFFLYCL